MALLLLPVLGWSGPKGSDPALAYESGIGLQVIADENFRLNARNVPSRKIIERIRQKTGTALNYTSLPEVLITVSCSGAIVDLLKCVLGDSNNMIVSYGENAEVAASAAIPEAIWILGSSGGPMDSGFESLAPPPCGPAQSDSEQEPGLNSPGKKATLSQQEKDALLKQLNSPDLSSRAEAITRLAGVVYADEDFDLLQDALNDEHPSIRAQAISTLAAHKASGFDHDPILSQAMLDPDASVRLMAVSNAGEDEPLLLMALEDADPNVRVLANIKLEQLSNMSSSKAQ